MIEFGIKDFVDILLVALSLTYLYQVMKKSRSSGVFTGLLIFVIAWFIVCRIFEMRLLGGIFSTLINVGSIALIVLFQDEIRRFFNNLGHQRATRFVKLFQRQEPNMAPQRSEIMAIVMACINMGRQHTGALIVIERTVTLTDVIASGETIDAAISQRLIENIFFKNSPLHDGALVISHRRLCSAGCILPVAHDSDIPKSLGLRHRAALGISQQCDAISIIVSEETGAISLAIGGHFTLRLSAEELERRLTELWKK